MATPAHGRIATEGEKAGHKGMASPSMEARRAGQKGRAGQYLLALKGRGRPARAGLSATGCWQSASVQQAGESVLAMPEALCTPADNDSW